MISLVFLWPCRISKKNPLANMEYRNIYNWFVNLWIVKSCSAVMIFQKKKMAMQKGVFLLLLSEIDWYTILHRQNQVLPGYFPPIIWGDTWKHSRKLCMLQELQQDVCLVKKLLLLVPAITVILQQQIANLASALQWMVAWVEGRWRSISSISTIGCSWFILYTYYMIWCSNCFLQIVSMLLYVCL